MQEQLKRTEALIGAEALRKLQRSTVAVLGIGGVGCAAVEALARTGIGRLILVDHDVFEASNLNRQLFATTQTLGQSKVEAAAHRVRLIAPDCQVEVWDSFLRPDNLEDLFARRPEVLIDAVDNVTVKLALMQRCFAQQLPLISSMGTGNRLDPSAFRIGDIADTAGSGDGLAKVIRRELKKRGVPRQPVVYSLEAPRSLVVDEEHGRHAPASIAFPPAAAGLLLASWAVQQLIAKS